MEISEIKKREREWKVGKAQQGDGHVARVHSS